MLQIWRLAVAVHCPRRGATGARSDMHWTPNRVTLLRVAVGFAAVCLFGRGPRMNLAAVGLTVASIALDALDGHIARRSKLATPVGAQIDILGDRMIENVYFTYFAVVGMVSLWLPVFFFARGAATDFLRGLQCVPAIPGEQTPCCKPGGDARWSPHAGAAACTPQ
jgi:phosphatidylglycerophosphate synthase